MPFPFGFNPKVERRNQRLRRIIAKHGKPTRSDLNDAIIRAGHKPLIDQPQPAINQELRRVCGAQNIGEKTDD